MRCGNRVHAGLCLLASLSIAAHVYAGSHKDVKRGQAGKKASPIAATTVATATTQTPASGMTGQPTPQQPGQISPVYEQLLADIQNLRSATQTQVRALLTPQQQGLLDALSVQSLPAGQTAPANNPAEGAETAAAAAPAAESEATTGGARPQMLAGLGQLDLTDAQRAAIHEIMSNLHAAMDAMRSEAQAEFRALLDPSQAAAFDALNAQAPDSNSTATDAAAGSPDALRLSAEQQAQAQEIFAQLATDEQQLHAVAEQQILAVLTDQQKAQLGALAGAGSAAQDSDAAGQPEADAVPAWYGGHSTNWAAGSTIVPPQALDQLGLSAAQGTGLTGLLNDLQAAVQAGVQQALATSRATATASH